MELEKWIFWNRDYSILTATLEMAAQGDILLAAVVLVLVILLPLIRLVALLALSLRRPSSGQDRATRWLLLLDRWSMVDVFCLALLVVTVKLGGLADVTMRGGFWFFAAGVLLSAVVSWILHREESAAGKEAGPPSAA
jgi:paraquat-inducible protein A